MDFWQMVGATVGILVVIVGAYYATRLLATRAAGIYQGRTVKILDRVSLSKDKSICIVEVLDKTYIIAFTDHGATLLDTLEAERYAQAEGAPAREEAPFAAASGGLTGLVQNAARTARRRFSARRSDVIDPTDTLSFAQDEDDLDAVYRKLQSRRPREDEDDPPFPRRSAK